MWKGLTNLVTMQIFQDTRLPVMTVCIQFSGPFMRIPMLTAVFGNRRPLEGSTRSFACAGPCGAKVLPGWMTVLCLRLMQKGGERGLNTEHSTARSSIDLVRPLSSPSTLPCNSLSLLLLPPSLLLSAPPLLPARSTPCASSTSKYYVFVANPPRLIYVHMKLRHRDCT